MSFKTNLTSTVYFKAAASETNHYWIYHDCYFIQCSWKTVSDLMKDHLIVALFADYNGANNSVVTEWGAKLAEFVTLANKTSPTNRFDSSEVFRYSRRIFSASTS